MKRFSIILLGVSLFTSAALFATGSHGEEVKASSNNHMGDHMHEGKMMNHSNANGMTNKEMKTPKENDHMGDHMHEGKMMNHSNTNGMTNNEMK